MADNRVSVVLEDLGRQFERGETGVPELVTIAQGADLQLESLGAESMGINNGLDDRKAELRGQIDALDAESRALQVAVREERSGILMARSMALDTALKKADPRSTEATFLKLFDAHPGRIEEAQEGAERLHKYAEWAGSRDQDRSPFVAMRVASSGGLWRLTRVVSVRTQDTQTKGSMIKIGHDLGVKDQFVGQAWMLDAEDIHEGDLWVGLEDLTEGVVLDEEDLSRVEADDVRPVIVGGETLVVNYFAKRFGVDASNEHISLANVKDPRMLLAAFGGLRAMGVEPRQELGTSNIVNQWVDLERNLLLDQLSTLRGRLPMYLRFSENKDLLLSVRQFPLGSDESLTAFSEDLSRKRKGQDVADTRPKRIKQELTEVRASASA